ncbi:hypothetical protein BH11MYX2_BH11MYX2_08900 [soil metagenome]
MQAIRDVGFGLLASTPKHRVLHEAPSLSPALADCSRVLVVGNSVELWSLFVADYKRSAALQAASDPLDAWVEDRLGSIVAKRPTFYAHVRYDGAFLPIQRIAVAAGLGVFSNSQLVLHPTVGPWLSLRALVATDDVSEPPPIPPGFGCNGDGCAAGLQAVLARPDATWRDWYELRASCRTADDKWRFSDEQIIYHYTKDCSVIGTGAKLPPR